jgi:hypothetical protein
MFQREWERMNKVWWSLLLLLCSHLALASSSETAIGWKVADHLPYLEARLKQGQLDALPRFAGYLA